MTPEFRIVSLCGSAGAVEAYTDILRSVPADSGMTFVVLTHRRVGIPCMLVKVLSRVTRMPVQEILNGQHFKPNNVYVIPAGKDLTINGSAFLLAPARTLRGWPDAFDIYLQSVARTTFRRAVTVILSGMAADGSAFLKELRATGGVNYAQTDARTPSMPDSAMRTGMIDYAASAVEIAGAICELRG
jgi:chemotaxis response regulator CheB